MYGMDEGLGRNRAVNTLLRLEIVILDSRNEMQLKKLKTLNIFIRSQLLI